MPANIFTAFVAFACLLGAAAIFLISLIGGGA